MFLCLYKISVAGNIIIMENCAYWSKSAINLNKKSHAFDSEYVGRYTGAPHRFHSENL